jgi:transposase
MFCRVKDYRRIATRYDKLTTNSITAVQVATILGYWFEARP